MGRQERQLDPDAGEVQRFAARLRELRREAGGITYRAMAERTPYTVSTLSRAAAGERLPSLSVTLAYVAACGGDRQEWESHWRLVSEAVAVQADDDAASEAPYPGLARFEPTDRERFFGRERLVDDLLRLVRGGRFTALFGASGSGKSSLLRAGLIPALQNGGSKAPTPGGIRICTPGERPMRTSASVLTPREGNGDTVVVVDQFEEVFTLCRDPVERARFVERVLAAREPGSRLRVVVAVRADFYGRCAEHPALARALNDASLLVGPMSPDQLRQAIVKPAQAEGLIVERALTARVIAEVADEPGGLPLMSHALLETWRRRKGRSLSLAGYEAAGGVRGAVARTAEDAWGQLNEEQTDLARRILLRLITPGEGAPDTRRPIDRGELAIAEPAQIASVLDHLARARLLTLDGTGIDLAHEALITAWPRFAGWVEAERERLRVHRRLTDDAGAWQDLQHDPGALYRGSRLAIAEESFPAERGSELTELESAFLTASLEARHQERRAAARTTRRLRVLAVALALLLITALTTTVIAVRQQQAALREQQRAVAAQETARSRQLAAESAALLDTDPDLASLLAVEAYRTDPTAEARSSLYAAATLPLQRRLTDPTGPIRSVAFSPDTDLLAAGTSQGTVRLWDVVSGELRRTFTPAQNTRDYLNGPVQEVAFSPDGTILATHSGVEGGIVQFWDVATGASRTLDDAKWVSSLAFSPDGSVLATGDSTGAVDLWEVSTGELHHSIPGDPAVGVVSVAYSPDGDTLATGDTRGEARLWEAATGELVRTLTGHTGSLTSLAFRSDGTALVTGSEDGTVLLWDPATGEKRRTFTAPRGDEVYAVALGSDDTMATAGADGSVRLWNTSSGLLFRTLMGHRDSVTSMVFGANGTTLASSDSAGTIRVWDMDAGNPRHQLAGHGDAVTALALSPDGSPLATASEDGTARLWDTVTGETRTELETGQATAVALSPDGSTLATGDLDGTVRLWDVATGERLRTLTGHDGGVASLAFSGDGVTLAAASHDGMLRLWNTRTGGTRATLDAGWVTAMVFSPDGSTLATGGVQDRARLWDTASGALRATFTGADWVNSMAFDPEGATLATSSEDGKVRLWDTATGQLRRTLTDPRHALVSVAFSPDRTTLATGALDGTVQLWDAATLEHRTSITGHHSAVTAMAFGLDGATLATGDQFGTVLYWEENVLTPAEAIDRVCHAVNRDLTQQERSLYVPDHPVRPVCDGQG